MSSSGTTHIRPKIRRNNRGGAKEIAPADTATTSNAANGATTTTPTTSATTDLPKSILRQPKYGIRTQQQQQQALEDLGQEQQSTAAEENGTPPPAVVRGTVMERPRTKRNKSKATTTATTTSLVDAKNAAVAIEGGGALQRIFEDLGLPFKLRYPEPQVKYLIN